MTPLRLYEETWRGFQEPWGREDAVERDLKARGYYLVDLIALPDTIPFWKALGYVPQAAEVPGEGLEMAKRL